MSARREIAGQRFNRWLALSYAGKSCWNCRCDCGTEVPVNVRTLIRGKSRGCKKCAVYPAPQPARVALEAAGCFYIYYTMIRRCTKKYDANYPRYGARGVFVCERWTRDPLAFVADMGPRPSGASLERKDNDGPYAPWNCKWATRYEQARNKRNNRRYSHDGQAKCAVEWSEIYGVPLYGLRARLLRGESVDFAVNAMKTGPYRHLCREERSHV
jgi:hypothetical protein